MHAAWNLTKTLHEKKKGTAEKKYMTLLSRSKASGRARLCVADSYLPTTSYFERKLLQLGFTALSPSKWGRDWVWWPHPVSIKLSLAPLLPHPLSLSHSLWSWSHVLHSSCSLHLKSLSAVSQMSSEWTILALFTELFDFILVIWLDLPEEGFF